MKCKELIIKTDGTSSKTTVSVDGTVIGGIQRLEMSADVSDIYVRVQLFKTVLNGDKAKTKKVKVRDFITQKLIEQDEIVTEPLMIEFNR